MKIYDITQELFGSKVYPGDLAPTRQQVKSIRKGEMCNLSNLSMCAHNGTHVDAPYHFCDGGLTIEALELDRVIGEAHVYAVKEEVTREDIARMRADGAKRVLLKGHVNLTPEAAWALRGLNLKLLGVESQTVEPEDGMRGIHVILLESEIALLEGIRLQGVPEGRYLLNAAPLKLGGADGAPCRAVLLEGVL